MIRQAADAYDRAARATLRADPSPTPAGNDLRRAARLWSVPHSPAGDPDPGPARAHGPACRLAEAIAELRDAQHHAAQAAAARQAAERLHAARAAYGAPAPAQRPRARTRRRPDEPGLSPPANGLAPRGVWSCSTWQPSLTQIAPIRGRADPPGSELGRAGSLLSMSARTSTVRV